ncbi:hypothetical protein BpHYR1_019205 [Brachionus plicatilis]|uniref:Uncharacterized protein n=1 Tax=Brachionus plicatilis TaxID=10195 RepID=A0A3M7RDW8_BRAPC|nr:hypothetical protein BpHYR1_019205 [Brachionus plicatilis]
MTMAISVSVSYVHFSAVWTNTMFVYQPRFDEERLYQIYPYWFHLHLGHDDNHIQIDASGLLFINHLMGFLISIFKNTNFNSRIFIK